MPLVGDNEWLQSAAGGQKTTEGAAPDFVILIALCGLNCFIVPNKQAKNDKGAASNNECEACTIVMNFSLCAFSYKYSN